jgi:hypothetical protein
MTAEDFATMYKNMRPALALATRLICTKSLQKWWHHTLNSQQRIYIDSKQRYLKALKLRRDVDEAFLELAGKIRWFWLPDVVFQDNGLTFWNPRGVQEEFASADYDDEQDDDEMNNEQDDEQTDEHMEDGDEDEDEAMEEDSEEGFIEDDSEEEETTEDDSEEEETLEDDSEEDEAMSEDDWQEDDEQADDQQEDHEIFDDEEELYGDSDHVPTIGVATHYLYALLSQWEHQPDLRLQLEFAVTLVHELAHAFHAEAHDTGAEVFHYRDDFAPESGFSWQQSIFGCNVDMFSWNIGPLCLTSFDQSFGFLSVYKPMDMQWVGKWFSKETWENGDMTFMKPVLPDDPAAP